MFSGYARFSEACAQAGIEAEAWDTLDTSRADILVKANRDKLVKDMKVGLVIFMLFALPCTTWSRARRNDGCGPGPLRDDREYLWGLPGLSLKDQSKVYEGNRLWRITYDLICTAASLTIPVVLENPLSSRVWLTPQVQRLAHRFPVTNGVAHFCQYGEPRRKAMRFLCIHVPGLAERLLACKPKARRCLRTGKKHVQLCGTDASGTWLTMRAQPYPRALCDVLANSLIEAAVAQQKKIMDDDLAVLFGKILAELTNVGHCVACGCGSVSCAATCAVAANPTNLHACFPWFRLHK